MTIQETAKILAIINEVYPAFGRDRNLKTTTEIWAKFFEDESYKVVEAAVMQFIASDVKGFAPSIGQIKAALHDVAGAEELSEVEAFALVSKACSNGFYGYKEEFNKLPPVIQEVIGQPEVIREWSQLPVDEFQTVVGSNFMRSYRVRATHAKERAKLPESMQAFLAEIRGSIGHPEFFVLPAAQEQPEGFLCETPEETGVQMAEYFKAEWEKVQLTMEEKMNGYMEVI